MIVSIPREVTRFSRHKCPARQEPLAKPASWIARDTQPFPPPTSKENTHSEENWVQQLHDECTDCEVVKPE